MNTQPPVLDASDLASGNETALLRLAAELKAPCEVWGLFHLVEHGIPAEELAEFDASMRAFFARPLAEKSLLRRARENARGY
jgi:isopenicillin N synthase-like dioxygenase